MLKRGNIEFFNDDYEIIDIIRYIRMPDDPEFTVLEAIERTPLNIDSGAIFWDTERVYALEKVRKKEVTRLVMAGVLKKNINHLLDYLHGNSPKRPPSDLYFSLLQYRNRIEEDL